MLAYPVMSLDEGSQEKRIQLLLLETHFTDEKWWVPYEVTLTIVDHVRD